jgi:hypothetical protein
MRATQEDHLVRPSASSTARIDRSDEEEVPAPDNLDFLAQAVEQDQDAS